MFKQVERINSIKWFAAILLFGVLQSCSTQNLFESDRKVTRGSEPKLHHKSHVHLLQPDDKISVSIWNHDDLSIGSVFGIYNSNEVYGKWVLINENGEANLPKIGSVQLAGLTSDEASAKLKSLYAVFIKDPVIVVKVLNRKVTVLGEVKTPGSYLLEKEDHTLIEAIGLAGGMDFYADKKKVKFIRDGQEFILDLTSMEDFETNNIVLQTGDIIYVPTRKGKVIDKKAPTLIPIASVATTLVVIISLFAK
ncbi:MAG: polysaccharide export protein [Chitinophagales bacterium]|nr:polysaccharide export protein [Chitinophagales bacterium]